MELIADEVQERGPPGMATRLFDGTLLSSPTARVLFSQHEREYGDGVGYCYTAHKYSASARIGSKRREYPEFLCRRTWWTARRITPGAR